MSGSSCCDYIKNRLSSVNSDADSGSECECVPGGQLHHLAREQTSRCLLYGLTCKVMLVGDSGTGKSCLLTKYADNVFNETTSTTVGIDFRTKIVHINGIEVKLQIWDTAGQERFRSITRAYYRNAQVLLLLYDVTDAASFANVRGWLAELDEYATDEVSIVLIGNKSDMNCDRRQVYYEDGRRLAEENGLTAFFETSAKTGENVSETFEALAKHWATEKRHRSASYIRSTTMSNDKSTKRILYCCT